jgi:hypothetical protein
MNAIAWDDGRKSDQTDYMSRLAVEFKRYGINMDVERETDLFEDRIRPGRSISLYLTGSIPADKIQFQKRRRIQAETC